MCVVFMCDGPVKIKTKKVVETWNTAYQHVFNILLQTAQRSSFKRGESVFVFILVGGGVGVKAPQLNEKERMSNKDAK